MGSSWGRRRCSSSWPRFVVRGGGPRCGDGDSSSSSGGVLICLLRGESVLQDPHWICVLWLCRASDLVFLSHFPSDLLVDRLPTVVVVLKCEYAVRGEIVIHAQEGFNEIFQRGQEQEKRQAYKNIYKWDAICSLSMLFKLMKVIFAAEMDAGTLEFSLY